MLKHYSLKQYAGIINSLISIVKSYDNFLSVIINTIVKKKFPVKVVLKNSKTLYLNCKSDVIILARNSLWKYCEIVDDALIIKKDDLPPVKLYGWRHNGDITDVFINEAYSFLPIKGNNVIDIGANIGESSIYFALHGAKKTISLEPFPKNNEVARMNIKTNSLENKIILLLAGCSNKVGEISVNPENEGAGFHLEEYDNGTKIPTMTLESILDTYNIDSAILKMDCEGSEYDIILSSNKETLRKFTHIEIEYHYGYDDLKKKLESVGFDVSITKPKCTYVPSGKYYIGYLYATRKNIL